MKPFLTLFLLSVLLTSCNSYYAHKIILTSGIDEKGYPEDVREEFKITDEKIYIFMRWVDLKEKTNEYEVKMYDGKGLLIATRKSEFTAESGSHNTWMWYTINKVMDAPGDWKYILFLNGYKIKEQKFKVLL
jgi:hypothetical protein